MKVQDIFEAIVPPSKPTVRPYSPLNKSYIGQGGSLRLKDTLPDTEDRGWDRRIALQAAERERFVNYGRAEEGTTETGKPYNIVASIKGPTGHRLKSQVDKFLDHHRNNYHEFVDIKVQPTEDEGIAIADIYINAQPQSLLLQAIKGGYYGSGK